MKKTEIVFLISVFSFAALFSLVSVRDALQLLPGRSSQASAAVGTAGQPRDVDLGKLQKMLRQHDLSSHEALYYKPVPAASDSGSPTRDNEVPAPPKTLREGESSDVTEP